jgi:hypothetical protein
MLLASASATRSASVSLEGDELQVAGLALDQRRDRGSALAVAHQKVTLPVAGNRAVFDLRRALGDHHHVGELSLAGAL